MNTVTTMAYDGDCLRVECRGAASGASPAPEKNRDTPGIYAAACCATCTVSTTLSAPLPEAL